MRELAEGWFAALTALARHAAQPGAGGRTPSDLPLAALAQTAPSPPKVIGQPQQPRLLEQQLRRPSLRHPVGGEFAQGRGCLRLDLV